MIIQRQKSFSTKDYNNQIVEQKEFNSKEQKARRKKALFKEFEEGKVTNRIPDINSTKKNVTGWRDIKKVSKITGAAPEDIRDGHVNLNNRAERVERGIRKAANNMRERGEEIDRKVLMADDEKTAKKLFKKSDKLFKDARRLEEFGNRENKIRLSIYRAEKQLDDFLKDKEKSREQAIKRVNAVRKKYPSTKVLKHLKLNKI